MRTTLVISDNLRICQALSDISNRQGLKLHFAHSPNAPPGIHALQLGKTIDLKVAAEHVAQLYDLVISAHCKQLFPRRLFERCECVNIHPGFNPDTRGWFPQVWGILYGKRVGMTVHRIDDQLDHGPIIARREVPVFIWDTSRSVYDRIVDSEIEWLESNLRALICGDYRVSVMEDDGQVYLKRDFDSVCCIDLEQHGTFREFYDKLRALSFDGYDNAYFVDPTTRRKIFISLAVKPPRS